MFKCDQHTKSLCGYVQVWQTHWESMWLCSSVTNTLRVYVVMFKCDRHTESLCSYVQVWPTHGESMWLCSSVTDTLRVYVVMFKCDQHTKSLCGYVQVWPTHWESMWLGSSVTSRLSNEPTHPLSPWCLRLSCPWCFTEGSNSLPLVPAPGLLCRRFKYFG